MALEINSAKQASAARASESATARRLVRHPKKVSHKDRMFFVEQLAMMLETGSDLHSSLNVLMKQTENPELARVIQAMNDDIGNGRTFSEALAKHPAVFSSTYVSLVAASESGGYLRRILQHITEMENQRDELRTTIVSALSYPGFLIVFSFAMVVFVLAVVFPKFASLFASIYDQLPATTKFLMWLSAFITDYWWLLLLAVPACLLPCAMWIKSPSGRHTMEMLELRTPALKHVFMQLYIIQTMRVLGLSLKNGVTLIEALGLSKDVVKNSVFIEFLDALIQDVTEGRSLASGFQQASFIPPIIRQMISTGENTGNLPLVTARIADYYQRELEKRLKLLGKAVEPVMLIVMGVVIGLLVSSLILPIFKLSHAVH